MAMNDETKRVVIQKIQEITENSLNVSVDFNELKLKLEGQCNKDDIRDTLQYLNEKGLIEVINPDHFLENLIIKKFKITAYFVDNANSN